MSEVIFAITVSLVLYTLLWKLPIDLPYRLHVMAGCKTSAHDIASMRSTYIDNLKYAADKLSQHNIMALIEPINSSISLPTYFLDNLEDGKDYRTHLSQV